MVWLPVSFENTNSPTEPSAAGSSTHRETPSVISRLQPTLVPRIPMVPEGVRTCMASGPVLATSPVMNTKVPVSIDINEEPVLDAAS